MGATRILTFSGEKLRQARKAKEWTQGRLAAAVGKKVASVIAWELGRRVPEPKTFKSLADALGIEPGDLLDLPAAEWGLAELRITRGLQQQQVAARIGMTPERYSYVESTYEYPSDEQITRLATLYGSTHADIDQAWQNARGRLTSPPSASPDDTED